MKNKVLLLMMLLCFAWFGVARAAIVEIGNGTNTQNSFPIKTDWTYSLTQQLFTAEEIGTEGTINAISFHYANTNPCSIPDIQVYMKNVDKNSFNNDHDMVQVYTSDKVWEGTFSATGEGWVTLTLDIPFEYDGTSNLLVCFYCPTNGNIGSFGNVFYYTSTTDYLSIAYYSSNFIPDINNVNTYSGAGWYKYGFRANVRMDITQKEAIPYTYGFEETAPFENWTVLTGATEIQSNSSNSNSGTHYLRFRGSTSNIVVLPQFTSPTNNLRLEFWTRPESYSNSSCGSFSVGYMTDLEDASSFVAIETYNYNDWTSDTYVKKTVDFGVEGVPANAYIAMRQHNCASMWYWYVDDVTVKTMPTCLEPANVHVVEGSLTYNSVTVTWDFGEGDMDQHFLQTSAFFDPAHLPWSYPWQSYTMTWDELDPDTDYTIGVRRYCSEDDQSEPVIMTIHTPPACNSVSNLHVTNLSHTAASIYWDAPESNCNCRMEWKKSSASEWIVHDQIGCGAGFGPGLDSNTSYTVRVLQYCNNGHQSDWEEISFTTLPDPMTIPFTESFDATSIPNRWARFTGLLNDVLEGTATLTPYDNDGWTFGARNGVFDSHARLNIWSNSTKYWLATPQVTMENNCQLSFELALTKYSGTLQPVDPTQQADDRFVVLASTNNGMTWTILREWNNTGSPYVYNDIPTTGEEVLIDLSAYQMGTYLTIAFYGESTVGDNGDNNLHIDNVSIDEMDMCAAPHNVRVLNTSEHGFWATFTPGAAAQQLWFFAMTTSGTTPPAYPQGSTTDPEGFGVSDMQNINSNSTYYLWMGIHCDEDETFYWSEPAQFTTPEACQPVDVSHEVEIVDVQPHSVTLSWEDYQGMATQWQVYHSYNTYLPTNEEYLNEVSVMTDEPYVTIDGLEGDYDFYFWIRSYCGDWYGTPQWSQWSDMITAHTLVSCPKPTNLVAHTTANSATISWMPGSNETEWTVEITCDDWGDYLPDSITNVPSITFDESFLSSMWGDGICYDREFTVYVTAECGEEDGSSEAAMIDFVVTDKETLTVNDGTNTNAYVPVYGLWVDQYSKSQFIIPAADLVEMANGSITGLTFYATQATVGWNNAEFEVYMTEVGYTTFDDATLVNWSSMTKVMNAAHLSISNNQMVVAFNTPYHYMGGNLMIGILETTSGNYGSCSWYGVTQQGSTAIGGYETSKALSLYQFLPKTTFDFIPACEAKMLPYTYGFEDIDEFDCWTMLNCSNNTGLNFNQSYAHDGDRCFDFYYNSNPPQYLISPKLETNTAVAVSFYYRNHSDYYPETFQVGYSTTTKSPDDFLWSAELTAADQYNWQRFEITFPEGTKYVAVKLTSNDMYYLFLDDFSFMPTFCPTKNRCELTFELTDSYGDTWNGNAIKVVDEETGIVLATMTNDYLNYDEDDDEYYPYTQTKTLALCDDRPVRFEWVSGKWSYECSYTVTDINGDVVFSGNGAMSAPITYTVSCDYLFVNDGNWNDGSNWSAGTVPPAYKNVIIAADAIIPAGYIAEAGAVTLDGGSITIKDGGQLMTSNNVEVTVEKNITGYGTGQGSYYLLSPPLWDDFVSATGVEGMIPSNASNYDLYTFDPEGPNNGAGDPFANREWRNYKTEPFYMETGLGCLYANKNDVTLKFTGTAIRNNYSGRTWQQYYDEYTEAAFGNWLLTGNFYTCNGYLVYADENYEIMETNFYVMNETGDGFELSETGVPLTLCQGAFIEKPASGKIYFMTYDLGLDKSGILDINLTQGDGKVDQARLRFGEGRSLGKLSFRDESMIYIPKDGEDLAVAYTGNAGEMPVNFKAMADGTFTLNFGNNGMSFSYLHLIDHLTGEDVDLLDTSTGSVSSYTFEGRTTDDVNRFTVVYVVEGSEDEQRVVYERHGARDGVEPCLPQSHGLVAHQSATCSVTQTIALSAGWNWFSTYLEVEDAIEMLQAIEASLGENGIEIRNSQVNTEYDSEWGWWGDLDEEGIVNEQMYKIRVNVPCTLTMEGIPANPADHPITIRKGWNWIGFPSAEAISLEDAFAGFAQEGDRIRNSGAQIEYDPDWGWFGDFETLVPGQGYMYYSASSVPRTLVFPAGAK